MHPRVRIYFSHASTARTTRYERSSRPRRRSLSTRARQDSKSTCSSVRAACVLPPTNACVPSMCRSCTNRAGWTPLLTAAWHGCSTTLIVLLDEYTAEMERANDAGWTPLLSRSLTARGHVVCPPHPTSLCGTWHVAGGRPCSRPPCMVGCGASRSCLHVGRGFTQPPTQGRRRLSIRERVRAHPRHSPTRGRTPDTAPRVGVETDLTRAPRR